MANLNLLTLTEHALFFLAILNPASKILFLSSRTPPFTGERLTHIAWRATFFAFIILFSFCICGDFVMLHIFKVQLYSLRIAGGLVLLLSGLNAVQKGIFFFSDDQAHNNDNEMSIVPLAAPLIAGPGSIAITISYSVEFGSFATIIVIASALLINLLIMLATKWIARGLAYFVMTGPLIRLTGLTIMMVAMQMILTGVGDWWREFTS